MDAALISTPYTRDVTSPGCFPSWAHQCEQLGAAILPTTSIASIHNFLPVNKGSVNCMSPSKICGYLPIFSGPEGGPSRTQLFRVHTMDETVQIALKEY
ncbi:Gag protein [Phytophthora palmivora]|uniref:Gag protein n=1 Tax=Phytophthora palmivora TaxID=4796 RepID=A0A2P4X4F5_9STRA|nr:Gag protein [Phytophthora palmivora]